MKNYQVLFRPAPSKVEPHPAAASAVHNPAGLGDIAALLFYQNRSQFCNNFCTPRRVRPEIMDQRKILPFTVIDQTDSCNKTHSSRQRPATCSQLNMIRPCRKHVRPHCPRCLCETLSLPCRRKARDGGNRPILLGYKIVESKSAVRRLKEKAVAQHNLSRPKMAVLRLPQAKMWT